MSKETVNPESNLQKWADNTGAFVRQVSSFRNFIKDDPNAEFPAERNRYHLYVSLACPWAHRTLIVRSLKGFEDIIGITVVNYIMSDEGWTFPEPEPLYGKLKLREIYFKAEPEYKGRFTVPVLWDKKKETIVSNESSEIIRMLNSEFNSFSCAPQLDFYPAPLRVQIDELNEWIYDCINNGVYKAGFARAQEPYELNVRKVFDGLERVEKLLSSSTYLTGDTLTEADIRLFTTIVRFDPVYHGHFKCNLKRIQDYPHLLNWLRRVYQMKGVSATVNMEHIKKHYYMSHTSINPSQVVPLSEGPDLSILPS